MAIDDARFVDGRLQGYDAVTFGRCLGLRQIGDSNVGMAFGQSKFNTRNGNRCAEPGQSGQHSIG